MGYSFQRLADAVLSLSRARTWAEAVLEWEVTGCALDPSHDGVCACGHDGLKWLFRIENKSADTTLFPIGSVCVRRFGREDLNDTIEALKEATLIDRERRTVERGHTLDATSPLITHHLVDHLHELGAFADEREYRALRRAVSTRHTIDTTRLVHANEVIRERVYPWLDGLRREGTIIDAAHGTAPPDEHT